MNTCNDNPIAQFLNSVFQNHSGAFSFKFRDGQRLDLCDYEVIATHAGDIFVYPHNPGRIFFLFAYGEDTDKNSYHECLVPPSAVLFRDGTSIYCWAMKSSVEEYDFRVDKHLMPFFEMQLGELVPMPGTNDWELIHAEANVGYDPDDLMTVYLPEVAIAPPLEDQLGAGRRYFDATVVTSFCEGSYGDEQIVISEGKSETSKNWKSVSIPLVEFIQSLCVHKVGQKSGPAWVFADMVPGERRNVSVKACTAVCLDIDNGFPSDKLDAAIADFGHLAIRYTTHSHGKGLSEISRDAIIKYRREAYVIDADLVRDYLREKKMWDESILKSIEIMSEDQTKQGIVVKISHDPMPKHRVVFPLCLPYVIAEQKDSQTNAIKNWAQVPTKIAETLGVPIDRSCVDPARLFYLPRHGDGQPNEISLFGGNLLCWQHVYPKKNELTPIESSQSRALAVSKGTTALEQFNAELDDEAAKSFANCLGAICAANLGLAYDELGQREMLLAENLPWTMNLGKELNDETLREIRFFLLRELQITFSKDNIYEACKTLAQYRRFHPICEYLDALVWDGVNRLDTWLETYMGAENNEYTRAVGPLPLIAAVRRVRKPGCKFDTVMIFEGSQGTDKSGALKILGGLWFSDGELGDLTKADAAIALQGIWIQELPELNAMSRSEVNELKAFVSRPRDRYRSPYDKVARSVPRQCVFFGTTNDSVYLSDPTGNRRYWPVKTNCIDMEALERDRDQLWAEAAQREANGASIVLPKHLWAVAGLEQANRQITDPWVDEISDYLETEKLLRVHTRTLLYDVLKLIGAQANSAAAKRVSGVMKTIGGWTPKHGLRIETRSAAGYEKEE